MVRASAEGGARQGFAEYQESFAPTPPPIRVVLRPARTMTARVVDPGGAPVEAAAVEVLFMGHGPLAQGRTDARGIAEFRLPAGADVLQVLALKPGLGFVYFENYRSWPPPQEPGSYPAEVTLSLDGARRVDIRLSDPAGRPAAGVEFHPGVLHKSGKLAGANLSGSDIALAATDAAGIARFPWIPKRIEAEVSFNCRP